MSAKRVWGIVAPSGDADWLWDTQEQAEEVLARGRGRYYPEGSKIDSLDLDELFGDYPELRAWTGQIGPHNAYCPLCRCRKSGDAREPNRRDEPCDARMDVGPDATGRYDCPCHQGIEEL